MGKNVEDLLKLIRKRSIKEKQHAEILVKLDACEDTLLTLEHEYSSELEALKQAELDAAKAFNDAEERLINYHPVSAEEFGLQTSAIIGTFSDTDNEPYLTVGAEALASGGLK